MELGVRDRWHVLDEIISAAQRVAMRQMLRPAALRMATAESVIDGLSRVLVLAMRLAPLYSLLRRP